MHAIELLAPAKNLQIGKIAINYGADAVYIGADKFGARAMAGNSLQDIAGLITYAHQYYARVYVTLNTILYDHELNAAQALIHELYDMGADALIIQDMGVLEMDIPPIPLFASTQTDNYQLEQIKFLEACGFQRIILARELSLSEIQEIRSQTRVALEAFVHGALCVSRSGRCYLSENLCERSANRGACAQPCRLAYDLTDASGKIIRQDKHLLSIKDMNRSAYIKPLIDAGISSFKIEGRLKSENYVKNIVAFYREKIDEALDDQSGYKKSSSGKTPIHFIPNPSKSFNRGFTGYFMDGRTDTLMQPETPKSIGEQMGMVHQVMPDYFTLKTTHDLTAGDGICFVHTEKGFSGTKIQRVEGQRIFPLNMDSIQKDMMIFRNYDAAFEKQLDHDTSQRKISVDLFIEETLEGLNIKAVDEDGVAVENIFPMQAEPAKDEGNNTQNIIKQLKKSGQTIFDIEHIHFVTPCRYFYPITFLNHCRREIIESLLQKRQAQFPAWKQERKPEHPPLPENHLTFQANVSNRMSKKFFEQCGVKTIAPAYEIKHAADATLMKCKHCIKYELNACPKYGQKPLQVFKEPLLLHLPKKTYQLVFDCRHCEMNLVALT